MEPVAIGCSKCNPTISRAEGEMPGMEGFVGTDDYFRMPKPLPSVFLDGESMENKEVCVLVTGPQGYILGYHQDPSIAYHIKTHRCSCGSESFARVLYRGEVDLRVKAPTYAP